MTEQNLEDNIIKELIIPLGYKYLNGYDIAPDGPTPLRTSYEDILLDKNVYESLKRINPNRTEADIQQAIKQLKNIYSIDLTYCNENFHTLLTDGIDIQYMENGSLRGGKVWLIDFDNISNNEFLCINQYTVVHNGVNRRPDIIIFVNGIPIVIFELKNPEDENATIEKAFHQLQTYKQQIPNLLTYNELLIISDGFEARYGTLTSPWSRFMKWKTKDGIKEDGNTNPQIITLAQTILKPETLLELIHDFIVFEKEQKYDKDSGLMRIESVKKIAAYHQYYAVNKAVERTKLAISGDHKAGVMWHTQGSGKSLSMVFYTGKLVKALDNPTVVVITDRNDLDDQLFDTFSASKQILRQQPVQAKSRSDLRELLNVSGGGIIFSTIQKFSPEEELNEAISQRKNIIVMADEAHRSQYGFGAKTQYITDESGQEVGTRTTYGLAKHLRDALPNASFIGFTGTPIESTDINTPNVFGNYIDIYDISQAVDDGATVKIYYESRLADVHLQKEYADQLDAEFEAIAETDEVGGNQLTKAKWTKVEAIVGHQDRLRDVAKDIIHHFESRQEIFQGKAMIVCMSRRIAVAMYDQIIKLKPEWHSSDLNEGEIKVVMTSTASDPLSWQIHSTNKVDRQKLASRFKDSDDKLKLVIVRDMWLTGFDAPCVTTMYVDKPMKGHSLMQSIARVNRVYKGKTGGLIVDYLGIASDLKNALGTYSQSGGEGKPTLDINEAVAKMKELHEIVDQLFWGFDYKRYFTAEFYQKLIILLEAQEFILEKDNKDQKTKENFLKFVVELSKAFSLVVPRPEALEIKDDLAFFQAVKARLMKYEPKESVRTNEEIEMAIRQIIDKAVVSEGVIDIQHAAGISSPDISILSDEFLEEARNKKYKNISIELLKKLLNDEIKVRMLKNIVQGKRLSEMLQETINRYRNNLLTSVEVIEALIKLAKEIKEESQRAVDLGLSDDELAFYDVLSENDSAKQVLGDSVLKLISQEVLLNLRNNASVDWNRRESVKAKLRVIVKRTLRKFGYPPDRQEKATENILKQAEAIVGRDNQTE